jgi:hypothetical protein
MFHNQAKIARAQRLLRMLEDDAPLLARRVAELTPEHQQSAKDYASRLIARARAELEKLIQEDSFWNSGDFTPEPAD